MMAILPHKPSLPDVRVHVCVCEVCFWMDVVHVCSWQLINQHLCSSPVGRQNIYRYRLKPTHGHVLLNFERQQESLFSPLNPPITDTQENLTKDAIDTRTFRPSVLKGFPAIAIAIDWLMGGMFSRSSTGSPVLFFPLRVSETVEAN